MAKSPDNESTAPTTPPAADPKPGRNPGYAEPQPRDGNDVRQPGTCKPVETPDADDDH